MKKFAYPIMDFLQEPIPHFLSQGFYGKKYCIRPSNLHFSNKIINTYAAALYWLTSCYKL